MRLTPSQWVGSPLSSGDRVIHFVGFFARLSVKKRGFATLDGLDSELEILTIRYDTRIARLYRCDSCDSLCIRYIGTICIAVLLTRTESCDTYLVSHDTNFYVTNY
jgi:hypothetical protein